MPTGIVDGDGSRVLIPSAGSAYTAGTPRYESGFIGVPATTGLSSTPYNLITKGVVEIAFIASSVVGDLVTINRSTQALARVAFAGGAAPGAGLSFFGQVVAVPGAGNTGTYGAFPKSGKMWVRIGLPNVGTA